MKRVLILDGDSIAYKCAAATETRNIKVIHVPTGKEKVFKHRTEFRELMKSKDKEINDDYVVVDEQHPEPIENTLSTIKHHIKRIQEATKADETLVFAGEQFNFRKDLLLPSEYKGNRKDTIRPVNLKEAKKYLHGVYKAVEAIGMETDDYCCIAAYDVLNRGDLPLLFRYEKDSDSFDGITVVEETDFGFEEYVIPELGELNYNKGVVKGKGLKFLCYQWIALDTADNYKASELSKTRFGAKSAYDVLNPCTSVKECLENVIATFKKLYPEDFEYTAWNGQVVQSNWRHMLELYFACAWMKRTHDDESNPAVLFNKYKVDYK